MNKYDFPLMLVNNDNQLQNISQNEGLAFYPHWDTFYKALCQSG